MIVGLLLVVWAFVQPFIRWPALGPEASSRLTLVVVCLLMGLVGCRRVSRPLPGSWVAWALGLLGLVAWHARGVVSEAAYFALMRETALLADGALLIVAIVFGVWGLRQVPRQWLRQLRWVGLIVMSVNLLVALWQWTHPATEVVPFQRVSQVAPSGLFGMPQVLAASALLWVPILWTWKKWLVLVPLALIALSGKTSAWLALGVVVWRLGLVAWPIWTVGCVSLAIWASTMPLWPKLVMRLATWELALTTSLIHPFVGQGFGPLTGVRVPVDSGFVLPGVHCDVVTLALHAGWLVTAWAVWEIGRALIRPASTKWAEACQAAWWGLSVLAVGQGVFGSCRVMGAALLLVGWYLVEQEHLDADPR